MKLRKRTMSPNRDATSVKRPGNFRRSIALVGTLLVSGIFGSVAAQEAAPKPVPSKMKKTKSGKPPSNLNTGCREAGVKWKTKHGGEIRAGPMFGEEVWFGVSWKTMFGIRINGVGEKQTMITSLRIPLIVSTPDDVIYVSMQFNDVKLKRSLVEPVIKAFCGTETPTAKKSKTEKTPRIVELLLKTPIEGATLEKALKEALGRVLTVQKGDLSEGKVEFTVEDSDEHEFILKIKGGEHDGKTFRLEREINCIVEVAGEQNTLVSLPYLLESISVSEEGEVNVNRKFDHSRKPKKYKVE